MASNGYICALRDPRIEGPLNIVFVFSGKRPWETIVRHLERSQNDAMIKWSDELREAFPEGIQILGREVCDQYHGDLVQIPPPPPGITRVPWEILDHEEEPVRANGARVIRIGSKKQAWIQRLRDEGHPLMNGRVGRPQNENQEEAK